MAARKFLSIALIAIMLAGCGAKGEGVKEDEATNTDHPVAAPVDDDDGTVAAPETQNESFEVDKGLLSVTVTVPASLLEGSDEDSIIADAKERGYYEDVTVNADGSATYKMSKSVYNKLLKETEDTVIKTINETVIGEDFPSIKNVAHNNKLTAFTITVVDRDAYENSFDGIALLGIYFTASFYQVFDGKTEASATFDIVDDSTGKVFKTINYPDDLNM